MPHLKRWLKTGIKNLPHLREVFRERDRLRAERDELTAERDHLWTERDQFRAERDQFGAERDLYKTWVPPGHFYSPVPSLEEIQQRETNIFDDTSSSVSAVDLNENEQIGLLDEFEQYYTKQPFSDEKQSHLRYFFKNPAYSYADAIFLYCMIRHTRPQAIVEVGCGYSSCVIQDTNELFFGNRIRCTLIEPYPEPLLALLKGSDEDRIEIIPKKLQDVDIARFQELSSGDILFIDSTHVTKAGSDVNYIFFQILPHLKSGVYIHFHDIFYPFQYPKEWIYEGRAWNEAYLLRAFLQHNNAFKIVLFGDFLAHFHKAKLQAQMPLCMRNTGGSIWIRKV